MLKARFDLQAMITDAAQLAWVAPAEQLFSWLSRRLTSPPGFAVLLCGGGDPVLVREGDSVQADTGRVSEVLFARTAPLVLECEAADLRSRDNHAVRGMLRCAVRILPEPAELAALRKQLIGSNSSLRMTDLRRHFLPVMRQVLAQLARAGTAEQLLGPRDEQQLRESVLGRLGPVCLAAGLALEPALSATFTSPDWQEHRRHVEQLDRREASAAARTRIQEALAAAQRERLSGVVQLLERLTAAAGRQAGLSITDLLSAFTESERGQMYAALWQLCPPARKTSRLLAVSGQEVLLFDPAAAGERPQRITIGDDLGPLRSVSADGACSDANLVLVGAARGVHLVDVASGGLRASLAVPLGGPELRGGVNRAVVHDDVAYATHSELGVLAWDQPFSDAPACRRLCEELTASVSTVRAASMRDGRLWFTADATLYALPPDRGAAGDCVACLSGTAALSAIAFSDHDVFVGDVNGRIVRCDLGDPESAEVLRGPSGGPVESLRVIDAGGVPRLIIADRSSALLEMVIGDSYVRRYESGGPIVRRAAAAEDVFLAMNDHRDRLLVWHPGEPARPRANVLIPHITGGSVQDIAVV